LQRGDLEEVCALVKDKMQRARRLYSIRGFTARLREWKRDDPVTAAIRRGRRNGGKPGELPAHVVAPSIDLDIESGRLDPAEAMGPLLRLIEEYPESDQLYIAAARILDRIDRKAARRVWKKFFERISITLEGYRRTLRMQTAIRGREATLEALHASSDDSRSLELLLCRGVGYEMLGEADHADACFRDLLAFHPDVEIVHREYCRLLVTRGLLVDAVQALEEAIERFPSANWFSRKLGTVRGSIDDVEALAPGELTAGRPASLVVLQRILDDLIAERTDPPAKPYLGRSLLLTSTLGPGGAERQLVNTALALHAAMTERRTIGGLQMVGPLVVGVRQTGGQQDNDFHLSALARAGVSVFEYGRWPAAGGDGDLSITARYGHHMRFLPRQMAEGISKLADWLAWQSPDVVQIWQDGTIYATALAALIARVPRIVLMVRTLPPIDRRDRLKPEYELLYRRLLAAPGVVLAANAAATARRYEEWLAQPAGRVRVLRNGISFVDRDAPADVRGLAEAFDRQTGHGFTVGCVMRVDENKRPLDWIRIAAGLAEHEPTSRFIVVGDGPLLGAMQAYAERIDLGPRILFVGRSQHVGFWYTRFDLLMQLSRHEGLPNSVIEAQVLGIPVMATAAGGSAEAVQRGVTGELIDDVDVLPYTAIVEKLVRLARAPERRARMGEAARAWAGRAFSIEAMLANTASLLSDGGPRT